jgi:glycosyltransferase involved in cell wall biosynthesis
MIKVLLTCYSAATHTSFGRITRDLWKRLHETRKFQIIQHGWFHRQTVADGAVPWDIIPTNAGYDEEGNPIISDADRYGAKSLGRVINRVRPDIVWSLADAYMIEHLVPYQQQFGFKLALWVPVDGEPYPTPFGGFLRGADRIYGITEWGADILSTSTEQPAKNIYHGVDTEIFKPISPERRDKVRRAALGAKYTEDVKVIGFVGKNQFRKMPWNIYPIQYYLRSGNWAYKEGVKAVKLGPYDRTRRKGERPATITRDWMPAKPIDARFWIHSYEQEEGINFRYEEEVWGQQGEVVYTGNLSPVKGLSDSEMNDLYNMFDVYASFSGGEGFGMPIIEAAAAGTPVVYTDYSGQAEVGERVGGVPVKQSGFIVEHGSGIERAITDIGDAVYQLYHMLTNPDKMPDSGSVRSLAREHFDYDVIAAQWASELTKLHNNKSTAMLGVEL